MRLAGVGREHSDGGRVVYSKAYDLRQLDRDRPKEQIAEAEDLLDRLHSAACAGRFLSITDKEKWGLRRAQLDEGSATGPLARAPVDLCRQGVRL